MKILFYFLFRATSIISLWGLLLIVLSLRLSNRHEGSFDYLYSLTGAALLPHLPVKKKPIEVPVLLNVILLQLLSNVELRVVSSLTAPPTID